jgi:hypothetical protein
MSAEDLLVTKSKRLMRFLNQAARPGLRMLPLALLAASAYASGVASTSTTFELTGTFDGGDTLSGYLDIDTTGSHGVLSGDLTIDPVIVFYTFSDLTNAGSVNEFSAGEFDYHDITFDGSANVGGNTATLILDLYLGSGDNLDGYTGGALCSDAQACGVDETSFTIFTGTGEGDPNLATGQLLPAPEPSTALLAIAGSAVFLALRGRKRRA